MRKSHHPMTKRIQSRMRKKSLHQKINERHLQMQRRIRSLIRRRIQHLLIRKIHHLMVTRIQNLMLKQIQHQKIKKSHHLMLKRTHQLLIRVKMTTKKMIQNQRKRMARTKIWTLQRILKTMRTLLRDL